MRFSEGFHCFQTEVAQTACPQLFLFCVCPPAAAAPEQQFGSATSAVRDVCNSARLPKQIPVIRAEPVVGESFGFSKSSPGELKSPYKSTEECHEGVSSLLEAAFRPVSAIRKKPICRKRSVTVSSEWRGMTAVRLAASSPLTSHRFLFRRGAVCPHGDVSLPSCYLRDVLAVMDLGRLNSGLVLPGFVMGLLAEKLAPHPVLP